MARYVRTLAFAMAAAVGLGATIARGDDPKPEPKPDAKAEAERAKRVEALVERLKASEAGARKAAAAQAATEQDAKVTHALVKALTDADAQVRRAVIAALAARSEAAGKKDAASALMTRMERLVQYADLQDELVAVLNALHDLAQPETVRVLVGGIDLERREPAILEARLRAVANVPTAEAITSLIDVMAKGGRGNAWWKKAVREALVYATGEKLGADADSWRKWWGDHAKTFDFAAASARRAKENASKKK